LNAEDPLGLSWWHAVTHFVCATARSVTKAVVVVAAAAFVVAFNVADGFDPADLAVDIAVGAAANVLLYNISSGVHTAAGQENAAEDGAAFGAAAYYIPIVAAALAISVPAANAAAGSGENVIQYLQNTKNPTVSGIAKAATVGAVQGASIDKLVKILKR
jgi:hypothetical protein